MTPSEITTQTDIPPQRQHVKTRTIPPCGKCGFQPRIDDYGTLQICGHKFGGGKNGRLYIFNSLEEVLKFEKGE